MTLKKYSKKFGSAHSYVFGKLVRYGESHILLLSESEEYQILIKIHMETRFKDYIVHMLNDTAFDILYDQVKAIHETGGTCYVKLNTDGKVVDIGTGITNASGLVRPAKARAAND